MDNEELKQEIESAIENNALQNALTKFTSAYPGNRAKVYKGYDFEAIREKIHEGKSYAAEHINELVDEFEKNGYILALRDTNKLDDVLKKVKKFTPKKYESNKKNFQKIITDYIDETNHISWYNRDKKIILIELINYLVFAFLFKYNYLLGLLLGFILSIILCLFLYNHKKENISYLVITFLIECILLSLVKDKLFLKTIINPLIIVIYQE